MENDAKKFTRWLKETGVLSLWVNNYLNYKSTYKKELIIKFFNDTNPLNYIDGAFVWESGSIEMWSVLNKLWWNYCAHYLSFEASIEQVETYFNRLK